MVVLSKSPSLSPAALRRTNSSLLAKLAASPSFASTFAYLKKSGTPNSTDTDTSSQSDTQSPEPNRVLQSILGEPAMQRIESRPASEEKDSASEGDETTRVAQCTNDGATSESLKQDVPMPSPKRTVKRQYVANLSFSLRLIGTFYTALCIGGGLIVVYLAQMITKLCCYAFTAADQRSLVCAKILNVVSYFTTTVLNPLWSVKVLTPIPDFAPSAHQRQGCIFVINHLSNADPWICSGAGIPSETAWICKGDLFKIPVGGWTLSNSGHLRVEFTKEKGGWGTKKGAIAKMMEQAEAYIDSGRSIVVYPEGIRNPNPNGPVGEFKIGFFNLAVKTNALVVPVAVSGSEKMWPVGENLFDASTAYVSFGEPISAEGETAESLRDKTYKIISDMRDQHPDRLNILHQTRL